MVSALLTPGEAPRPLSFGEGLLLVGVGVGLVVDLAWCYGGAMVRDAPVSRRHTRYVRWIVTLLPVASATVATFGS